eukprot:14809154-Heterocapsa_arctica.AAC.1
MVNPGYPYLHTLCFGLRSPGVPLRGFHASVSLGNIGGLRALRAGGIPNPSSSNSSSSSCSSSSSTSSSS